MTADASTFACPPSLWRTVASASGLAWPPRSPEDMAGVVRALERQRLLAIAACDTALPADVRQHVEGRLAEVAAPAERIAREQDDALAMLVSGLPCDWLAVNGADFRTRLYPSPALRPMSDVDVLLKPADIPNASAWLTSQGYAPMPRALAAIDRGFQLPGREHWIDVYDAFAQRQRIDVDYDEIWRERIVGPDRLPRMALHHALAVHALRLANEQFVAPVRRFLDLWLLSRDEAVVRQAIDTARRWRIARSMYSTMVVLRRLLPESAADPWAAEVDGLVGEGARRRLERFVVRKAPFDALPSRPVQIGRKLLLLDTSAHRLRFVAAHVAVLAQRAVGRG
jgi:hypothetical protein